MVLSLKFLELAHIVHAMPVLGTGWQLGCGRITCSGGIAEQDWLGPYL